MAGKKFRTFDAAIKDAGLELEANGKPVHVGHWQGMDVKSNPQMATHELMDYSFTCGISPLLDVLKVEIKPNLPWADDHFLERVGGVGLNPGEQYKNWPYYKRQQENDVHRVEEGQFSHTYMERFWPNNIRKNTSNNLYKDYHGIRYRYGDLNDILVLLLREPLTRQAFFPVWFPEDTGSVHGGRVPCTLGYQFMMRDGHLHIFYPIRACDYLRHFRDDIYLACRLLLWVLEELRKSDPETWMYIRPGDLRMQIYSLHVFAGEVGRLTN